MKLLNILKYIAPVVILLPACKDVLEPDLSKETIALITPKDHDTTSESSITFWWTKVDEQNTYKYRIQIAKPDFASPQTLILDSTTTSDKYTITLGPGSYQWRVRTENGSSSSAYSTRSLVVDSTKNLSGQTIQLIAPANNSTVTALPVNFSWYALTAAKVYNLQIRTLLGASILQASDITSNNYSYTFQAYGSYQWRVSAENDNSISQPSSWNILHVLLKAPYSLASTDSVNAPGSINLNWNNYSPATGDSLMIYKDNMSGTPVISTYTTGKSYIYLSSSAGYASGHTYYWRVRSTDGTNVSAWVPGNSFKIK